MIIKYKIIFYIKYKIYLSKCNITIYSSPTSWSSLAFKQFSNLWIIIYELLFIYLFIITPRQHTCAMYAVPC